MGKISIEIRRKFQTGIFICLFATFMIILLVVNLVDYVKAHETSKTKRFAELDKMKSANSNQTLIKLLKNQTNDVQMISEKNKVDDKIQFYSNHNYGNKKFDQRTSYDLGLEEDGFTKSLEGKNSASFQGYEPTFPENVMNIKNSRSKGTKPWNNNSELLEPPMPVADHIKGHSMTRANKKSDYHYYPHEINELMPNQSKEYFEDERELDKKNFLNNGSPFQLPAKDSESDSHEPLPTKLSNQYAKKKPGKNRKKPLTLLMDIYPMSRDAEDNVGEENSRKYFHRKPSRGKIFFIPIKSKAKFAEPMISSLISPSDKRNSNRLLVKLNLYPDRKKIQGNEILKRGGYVEPINRMRSDKIALPGFFRRKKKSPSGQCAILCYDPPRTSFKSRSRLQRREKNLRRKSGNDSQ